MPVLASNQRKILEDACTKGRRVAEQAVGAALTSLAVTADRPPAHLNEIERKLRRGLRAKSRQLGDTGNKLDLLVSECAYEQWHRLLFARFLAENSLLIHPEYRAPVTIEDCEELAEALGEPDGWSVAARFAAEILPGIFRLDDPCVRLRPAPEGRLALERILAGLPAEVFAADDALGWVYQFWQKDKKEEVNASERKIGGADLGPVTQLFTENYMVRFLLENSLGAWWAARHPDSPLLKGFDYLRLDDNGHPVSGSFAGWPDRVADVTVMDPCCGSGHFLVEAFSMLWKMRVEEDGVAALHAQDAVLRDNLFGLELDPRCVQIAMFAVALQAWKAGGGWRDLPVPNIACSGIPVKAPVDEWKALANGDMRLEDALVRLHILFSDAETLGSLIDPRRASEGTVTERMAQRSFADVRWDEIYPFLANLDSNGASDPAGAALGADASAVARAAHFLSRRFTLVATNVPYLGLGKMTDVLARFVRNHFSEAKHDLASVFIDRALALAQPGGTAVVVAPQSWLYMPRYEPYRTQKLRAARFDLVGRLGPQAFEVVSGWVVPVSLYLLSEAPPVPNHEVPSIDASSAVGRGKATVLQCGSVRRALQRDQLRNPDARITFLEPGATQWLDEYAESRYGLRSGDSRRFIRPFWEFPRRDLSWVPHLTTVPDTCAYGGRQNWLWWQAGRGALAELAKLGIASLQGGDAWGRRGVVVSLMGHLPTYLYLGERFDNNCAVVWPKRDDDLPAVWAYLSSPEFNEQVRIIDQSLKVMNATLLKVPFDADRWREVAEEAGPLPEPSSDDPTQWLFEGRPEVSTAPLQVAVARLVGYRWPEQAPTDDLDTFVDGDGIVCLPSVGGEAPAADRLQEVLAAAFGAGWSAAKIRALLEQAGSKKKNLGDWLRDDFFKPHSALFENRPFVWHIWDRQRDGFAALVNYHRLDRKMLEKLTYTYLGDWIERQRAEVRDDKAGAEARLAAASKLRRSLELILEGEPPFDIYVRWKSLAEQPIGWDPDVNDGVRLNVRPFVEAGVLRSSFSIHWRKDRGKNPDGSERLNDLHFTTTEKRAARGERSE